MFIYVCMYNVYMAMRNDKRAMIFAVSLSLSLWLARPLQSSTHIHSHPATIYHSMLSLVFHFILWIKKVTTCARWCEKKCENERFILLFSVSLVNVLCEWSESKMLRMSRRKRVKFIFLKFAMKSKRHESSVFSVCIIGFIAHEKPSRKSWLAHFYVYERERERSVCAEKGFYFYGICISFNG